MGNMVVCAEPLAALAGQEIFEAGGNAIDAVVATAFAQGVDDPLLTGIGGLGLLYYYNHQERRGRVLNCLVSIGSEPVPESWVRELVGRNETVGTFVIQSGANQIGYQSIMVPGFVRGCWNAFQRFGSGRLSWAELLQPAIRIAREGHAVYPFESIGGGTRESRPGYVGLTERLQITPDAARIYLKEDGTPYDPGEWRVQADLARTLQQLADAGGDDFYTGDIARAIAKDLAEHQGLFNANDLRDYEVLDQEPFSTTYRGYEVTSTSMPSGAAAFVEMMNILQHFDVASLEHNSVEYIDLFSRVQRAIFSDYAQLKSCTIEEGMKRARFNISAERARYWAERIKSGDRIQVRGGKVEPGTTHVTVIDKDLNVATMTHSIGGLAGSGVITPGLGFLYNNFLGHFNPIPGQYNSIEAGKRLSGSVPAIVFKDGKPYIAAGAPSGSRIISSVTQAIVNVLDHGMDMRGAVSVPRFHSEEEQVLFLEPVFSEETAGALETLGNEIRRSTLMSCVSAIRVLDDGTLEAGSDPRGGGGVGQTP